MSGEDLQGLLYPRKEDAERDREPRLRRLRQELEDPETRAELAVLLERLRRRREERRNDPDAAWDKARREGSTDILSMSKSSGSTDILSVSSKKADGQDVRPTGEDELTALSRQLAVSLDARKPRSIPLPPAFWVPGLVGIVIGALAVWMALSMLPQLTTSHPASFSAALQQLIRNERPSADEFAQLDGVLKQYEEQQSAPQPPQTPRTRAISGKVQDLLREYQPGAGEIRELRKLIGVYHPPSS